MSSSPRFLLLPGFASIIAAVSACSSAGDAFGSGTGSTGGTDGSAAGASAGGAGGSSGNGGASGRGAGGGGGSGGAGASGAGGSVAADGGPSGGDAASDGCAPDGDGDGQTVCAGDCDDGDPSSYRGAPEICGDSKDNDCNGALDNGCGGVGTFVSAQAGDDSNAGTQAAPVKTIAKALANAQTLGSGADVYIADGTYAEDVDLVEGTSLLGGYDCAALPCTWARKASACATIVKPPTAEGIHAGSTITRATAIDGLRIEGAAGDSSPRFGRAALTIEAGSPTVTNNCIYGPDSNGSDFKLARTHGIAIVGQTTDPAGALIEGNQISGGDQTNGQSTSAVSFDWAVTGKTIAVLRKNKIAGGTTSGSAAGISHWSITTGSVIEDNDIGGGTATGGGTAFATRGGGTVVFRGNRINAAAAYGTACAASGTNGGNGLRIWCGGVDSESATATFENNIVYGASAPNSVAVRLGEFEVPAGAVVLNGNTLFGHAPNGGTLAPSYSAAVVLTIGTCGTCGFNAHVGKIRNDIFVAEHGANRFGIFEDAPAGKTQQPVALENNLFYIPGLAANDALYRAYDGTNASLLTTIGAVNAITLSSGPVGNNISGNPALDATGHLGATSPARNAGTSTEAPATDMDGETRPKGSAIDIGADEAG